MPASNRTGTTPDNKARVVVGGSLLSPEDIFVAAGCQQGFLHFTTALQLAINLVDAILEINGCGYLLEVRPITGGTPVYIPGVLEIVVHDELWTAFGLDKSLLTGPHAAKSFTFRFVKDEKAERTIAFLARVKEVKESDP